MAMEIEAKLKVDDLAIVRERLQSLHGVPAGTRLETNRLFDRADQSLRTGDRAIRVRTRRDLQDGHEDAILTYKGPRQSSEFKSREEIETHISDGQAMVGILLALGFSQSLSFEKKRESWILDDCHVELDEVPHFGYFVEIEGPDSTSIAAVQQKLGLDPLSPIKTSYVAMMSQWLDGQKAQERVVRFDPG